MGWLEEQYKGTQTLKDGTKEGRGLGAFLWQQFVDEDKLNKEAQRKVLQQIAESKGYDLSELDVKDDATTYDVQGAATRKTKADAKTSRQEDFKRQEGLITKGQVPQMAQIAESTAAREESNEILRAQLSSAERRALEARIEAREQRALELEYQRMRDRKEDRQYNERMEKLDRKDRILALQNIAAGLASLGAAFAV